VNEGLRSCCSAGSEGILPSHAAEGETPALLKRRQPSFTSYGLIAMTEFPLLQSIFLGSTVLRWLLALLTLLAILAGIAIWRRLFSRHLKVRVPRTNTILDDLGLVVTETTRTPLVLLLALYAASLWLSLPGQLSTLLRSLAVIVLLVQIGIWGNALIARWAARYEERNLATNSAAAGTARLLGFLARLALYIVIFLLILDNIPGIEVTTLLASLGIGGIAVALAVQNILGDLFASLSIAIDKPFVVGDFIAVGSETGTVEEIGLKTTRLRSISGEQLIFSNTDLLASRIRNFGRMEERRIVFTIGVAYETETAMLEAIPEMLRAIIEAQDHTRFDRAHFARFEAYDLSFEVVYFVLSPDFKLYMDIQHAINLAIVERFRAEGIDIIYPTQQVYLLEQAATPRSQASRPAAPSGVMRGDAE